MTYLLLALSLVTILVTLMAPGLFIAERLQRKYTIATQYTPLVGLLMSCLIGYGAFWVYLISPLAGAWFATTLFVISWSIVAWFIVDRRYHQFFSNNDVLIPLVILLLVCLFYNTIALACRSDRYADSCYVNSLSIDNYVSSMFAQNVRVGEPKALIGDWQGGDRPPLQSGVMLSQSVLTANLSTGKFNTQILGSLLQTSWVLAVWALCRSIGLRYREIALVIVGCIFTGFFFFNSIIVWPKMLAGSFTILAIALLYFEKSKYRYIFAALASGAALLAHTGSAFTLVPLWISVLVIKKYRPVLKQVFLVASIGAALILPWIAYQQFYDPPSNRLSKWFFAGVIEKDERQLANAIVDEYRKTNVSEAILNKAQASAGIVLGSPDYTLVGEGKFAKLRDLDFRHLIIALGVANLGWAILLIKRYRNKLDKDFLGKARVLLLLVALSLALWISTIYLPELSAIHAGSYANVIILFSVLYMILVKAITNFMKYILAVQVATFLPIWVISAYYMYPAPTFVYIPAIVSGLVLAAYLSHISYTKNL